MGIETKTLGVLIDELMTTNMKIFRNLDTLSVTEDREAGELFKTTQTLNRRRTELIQAIDRTMGQGEQTITDKTYR